jgi:hypothetical protein
MKNPNQKHKITSLDVTLVAQQVWLFKIVKRFWEASA